MVEKSTQSWKMLHAKPRFRNSSGHLNVQITTRKGLPWGYSDAREGCRVLTDGEVYHPCMPNLGIGGTFESPTQINAWLPVHLKCTRSSTTLYEINLSLLEGFQQAPPETEAFS